jgi:hypothetical protein
MVTGSTHTQDPSALRKKDCLTSCSVTAPPRLPAETIGRLRAGDYMRRTNR